MPLPPYIHEPLADPERYQTVYSRIEGSVASSTAGLHFTPELLLALRERGVHFASVTLHIGLDTFRPVQVEEIEEHQIHREWAELSAETAKAVNETSARRRPGDRDRHDGRAHAGERGQDRAGLPPVRRGARRAPSAAGSGSPRSPARPTCSSARASFSGRWT